MTTDNRGCTALLLAGTRPGVDPLASHFGVPAKALIGLGGMSMIERVLGVLSTCSDVRRTIVLSQEPALLIAHLGDDWAGRHPEVSFETCGDSVSAAIGEAIAAHGDDYPFFVTTADNALLDRETIDAFVAGAVNSRGDVAVGLVERRTLLASYPESRRTWLKFRGGAYSGANLFWFARPRGLRVLETWQGIEQERKRGRAVIGAFGPLLLAAVALRLATLHQAIDRASRRLGIRAAAIVLRRAEACIDIDTVADHALAETILADSLKRNDPIGG